MKASTLFTMLLISIYSYSQNATRNFELILPEVKIHKSLYNFIELMDSRIDTSNIGIVQVGVLNKKARVVTKVPLAIQLSNKLNAFIDSTAKSGNLLLNLRQLSFAEVTGMTNEKGYVLMRAELYAKNGSEFHKLAAIDTAMVVKAFDVTKVLFRAGSRLISDFIEFSLLKAASGPVYTLDDVIHIDDREKQGIALYTKDSYVDGIYLTFESFKNQTPDKQVKVDYTRKGKIKWINGVDDKGRKMIFKLTDAYALIDKGKIYVLTEFGYYPVTKKENDFYFTGKGEVNPNTTAAVAAGVAFGLLGALIVSGVGGSSEFYHKIDHLNGSFIRLNSIK